MLGVACLACPFDGLAPTMRGRLVTSRGRAALSGPTIPLLLLSSGRAVTQDGRPELVPDVAAAVMGAATAVLL